MYDLRAHQLKPVWVLVGFILTVHFCSQVASARSADNLLEISRKLECASNSNDANQLLLELMGNVHPETQLPNEHGRVETPYSLHAGTMDILLKSMTTAGAKYPEIASQLEHTILQWSYCSLIEDDQLYDYIEQDGTIQRQLVAYDSPVGWGGYQALGLLEDKTNRFTFSSYNYGDTPHSFYEARYHSLFRERCLPHPADGKLFIDKQTYFPNRVAQSAYTPTKTYPYSWGPSCDATGNQYAADDWLALERIAIESQAVEIPAVLQAETQAKTKNKTENNREILAAESRAQKNRVAEQLLVQQRKDKQRQEEQRKAEAVALQKLAAERLALRDAELRQAQEKEAAQLLLKKQELARDKLAQQKIEQEQLLHQKLLQEIQAEEEKERQLLAERQSREQQIAKDSVTRDADVPTSVVVDLTSFNPTVEEVPVQIPQTTTGGLNANAVIETNTNGSTTKKRKKLGISGSFSLSNKSFESDGFSLSSGISYKPIKDSFWFIRSALKITNGDDPLAYSWGIGYDDWHTKTWAVQLNHWGPLKPGDGLDIKNAVGAITYKFGSEFMKKKKLGSFASFSQNLSGDPALTWGLSWSPRPKWFMRSSFSKKLTGGDYTWAYGFGYANYSANTWSLEYNNWGPNKVLEDNFKDNGLVSLTYRWSF